MRTREVIVDPDAKEDLRDLYHWIAVGGSPRSAENYLLRIQDFINGLDIAAERGTPLDEVDPGLRSIRSNRSFWRFGSPKRPPSSREYSTTPATG